MRLELEGEVTPSRSHDAAIQEDVDVIGISILSPGHLRLIGDVLSELRKREVTDRLILVGGTIPRDDIKALKESGVDEIFLPGTPLDTITAYVKENGTSKRVAD